MQQFESITLNVEDFVCVLQNIQIVRNE